MIRPAIRSDAVEAIPLILQAIGHVAHLLSGTSEDHETGSILKEFFAEENNRLSHQNALVMEEEGQLIGIAIAYDGARASELDRPLERAAAKRLGQPDYRIPTEAETSEFYLDTVSVSPSRQGRGYGRQLIEAGCDRARKLGHLRVALLVDLENEAAKRLYERIGFRADYTRRLAGREYWHMVRVLGPS
jgi:ribosomal protein S18 acetylase RimI-like enzyme